VAAEAFGGLDAFAGDPQADAAPAEFWWARRRRFHREDDRR